MSTPTILRKSFGAIETKVLDPAKGLVETMFSVTSNLDRQNDIIEPGAFGKALSAKASVPVVYAHKWDDINSVLGKTVAWRELLPGDPSLPSSLLTKGYGGVRATIQFDQETPSGRVAFTHVKNGNLTEWSFAFDIEDGEEKYEDDARHIKSIREVYEVTLALIGANPATQTLDFKSLVEAEAPSDYDQALDELLEIASLAIDEHATTLTPEPIQAKSNDEAIFLAAQAAILSDLSVLTPSVPDYAKASRDDEPDFDNFLTYPQQGVITRG